MESTKSTDIRLRQHISTIRKYLAHFDVAAGERLYELQSDWRHLLMVLKDQAASLIRCTVPQLKEQEQP